MVGLGLEKLVYQMRTFLYQFYDTERLFFFLNQALVTKGIGREVAQKAIKLVFEDDKESGDGMRVALSKVSMDRLFVEASKQWMRGMDAPRETRKSRIVRWLQYRGFDWDVTITILKKLQTKFPP